MSFPSVTSALCSNYITVYGEIYKLLQEEMKNKSSGLYKTTACNIDKTNSAKIITVTSIILSLALTLAISNIQNLILWPILYAVISSFIRRINLRIQKCRIKSRTKQKRILPGKLGENFSIVFVTQSRAYTQCENPANKASPRHWKSMFTFRAVSACKAKLHSPADNMSKKQNMSFLYSIQTDIF